MDSFVAPEIDQSVGHVLYKLSGHIVFYSTQDDSRFNGLLANVLDGHVLCKPSGHIVFYSTQDDSRFNGLLADLLDGHVLCKLSGHVVFYSTQDDSRFRGLLADLLAIDFEAVPALLKLPADFAGFDFILIGITVHAESTDKSQLKHCLLLAQVTF